MINRIFSTLIIVSAFASLAAESAPQGPSHHEVEIFVLLDELRTNPRMGERVIVDAIRDKRISDVQEAMWARGGLSEGGKHCHLVLSPQLSAAARSMLAAGVQPPVKQEHDAKAEARAAGYAAADKAVSALIASGAPDLGLAFAKACTVVINEGAPAANGYRILSYAGAMACRATWREVGIAVASAKDGTYSVVVLLGTGSAPRLIGGVAYLDANRNERLDPGEGRAGVTVTSGTTTVTTGPGGAWWMDGAAGAEQRVTISADGFQGIRTVAAGETSAYITWRVPVASEVKAVDKLIAEAEAAASLPDMEKRAGPLAALLIGARRTVLDDQRGEKVAKLIEPVQGRYESTRDAVLDVLGESPADAGKLIAAQRKSWNGAMPGWFKEAAALPAMRQQVVAAVSGGAAGATAKACKSLAAQITKAMATTPEPSFYRLYESWLDQLVAVLPAVQADVKKSGKHAK